MKHVSIHSPAIASKATETERSILVLSHSKTKIIKKPRAQ